MSRPRWGLLIVLLGAALAVAVPAAPSHAATAITFTAPELLGVPTDASVTLNLVPETTVQLVVDYGTSTGTYDASTPERTAEGGDPHEVVLDALQPNRRYFYRVRYQVPGETDWTSRPEHTFQTRRSALAPFTFTITSDSHLRHLTDASAQLRYQHAVENIALDQPDLHFDLGDAFVNNTFSNLSQIENLYLEQRRILGAFSHSTPVFLGVGNHENEEGWNLDDTIPLGIWNIQARKRHFPTPVPGPFYTGNADPLPAVGGDGLREDYYAFEWGAATFIVLDPFQYTMAKPYGTIAGEGGDDPLQGDQWNWTLGFEQFDWLRTTLEQADTEFIFVFSHHVTGGQPDVAPNAGAPGYVRGGAAAADYFEWGGRNADGSWGFDIQRPGWGGVPVHQLMVQNGVTAFFHGHDHQFAHELVDGVVYQALAAPSITSGFGIYSENAPETLRVLPGAGHVRVSVEPTAGRAVVDYVRADEQLPGINGRVDHTYSIGSRTPANQAPTVSAGPDQVLASGTSRLTLTGIVDDDGLPVPPGALDVSWAIASAPQGATVAFDLPSSSATGVSVDRDGIYRFRLTASDGSLSASSTVTVTIETATSSRCAPVGVWAEAEAAAFSGTVGVQPDAGASGGLAVASGERTGDQRLAFVPTTNPGHVELCFDLAEAGSYDLIAGVRGPSTSSNSFWVTIDDHTANAVRVSYTAGGYLDHPVTTRALSAGRHSVRFWVREDGSYLDRVAFSNDGAVPTTTTPTTTTPTSTTTTTAPTTTTTTTTTTAPTTTAPTTTTTTTTTTPPGSCTTTAEAENGTLTGNFLIVSDQGRNTAFTPEGSGEHKTFGQGPFRGYVELCVNAPTTGTYDLISTVRGPRTSSNSFWITIDDHTTSPINLSFAALPDYLDTFTRGIELTAGEHTIRYWVREDGTYLDRITIVGPDGAPPTTTTPTSTTTTTAPTTTTTTTTTTPPGSCTTTAEAENGTLTGNFLIVSDQGRNTAFTPEGSGEHKTFGQGPFRGYVELCVNAPTTGTYDLISTVRGPRTSSNSFWITIDDHTTSPINLSFAALPDYLDTFTRGIELTAGEHTIRYWVREDGTYLDRITIS